MRVALEGVSRPGEQWYEEQVFVLGLEPAREVKVFTDSPPSRPVDWPANVSGRLVGLSLDEALRLGPGHSNGFELVYRGRRYKFTLLSKEGDFAGRRDW